MEKEADFNQAKETLRSCSAPQERLTASLNLVKTHPNEALSELIKMVEGRRTGLSNSYNNFADQLIGIIALSQTKDPRALKYLKKLSEERVKSPDLVGCSYKGNTFIDAKVYFPKAKGRLKEHLNTILFEHKRIPAFDYQAYKSVNPAHSTLATAIRTLEASLS